MKLIGTLSFLGVSVIIVLEALVVFWTTKRVVRLHKNFFEDERSVSTPLGRSSTDTGIGAAGGQGAAF